MSEPFDFAEPFNQDACTLCGECFHQCPVMKLPIDTARAEIRALVNGEDTSHVLQKCTSCHSCNVICPENANPANLILQRWYRQYNSNGMPAQARYFMPHADLNFRTFVLDHLPDDEKELVARWDDDSPCEEIFYPGCNFITVPYLTMTSLLDGLEIRGALDLCCGEMYYRMGRFDQLREVALKLTAHFKKIGVKRMYIPCTAGRNLFTSILPRFGGEFNFEIVHILPWIYEKIRSGELKIANRLEMTTTIHDSCHAKAFGDGFMDLPRKLLEELGVTVLEQEYIRDMKLCCGIGGGFSDYSNYNPFKITLTANRALKTSHQPGADAVAVYCAGCMQQLSVAQLINPIRNMPVYHLLELVQLAIGETPQRRIRQRARLILAGVLRYQAPMLLSRKRYTMKGLEIEPLR